MKLANFFIILQELYKSLLGCAWLQNTLYSVFCVDWVLQFLLLSAWFEICRRGRYYSQATTYTYIYAQSCIPYLDHVQGYHNYKHE